MRKVKKVRPYSRVGYNHDYDSKKSKFAVRDKLVELSSFTDDSGVFYMLNDISLLFNQQRLENRVAPTELREMFNRFSPNKSRYLAQLDDDTLLSTLKSRHIQSLSELRSWTEYCMENYDSLIKEAEEKARLAAEQAAAEQAAAGAAAAGAAAAGAAAAGASSASATPE